MKLVSDDRCRVQSRDLSKATKLFTLDESGFATLKLQLEIAAP